MLIVVNINKCNKLVGLTNASLFLLILFCCGVELISTVAANKAMHFLLANTRKLPACLAELTSSISPQLEKSFMPHFFPPRTLNLTAAVPSIQQFEGRGASVTSVVLLMLAFSSLAPQTCSLGFFPL